MLNAYSKDVDWVQSMMALNVAFFGNETLVSAGGTVGVTMPAIDGGAMHCLGAEGMKGYARLGAEAMKGSKLIVFSSGISRHNVRTYFLPSAAHYANWSDVLAELATRYSERSWACVVECACMQLLAP